MSASSSPRARLGSPTLADLALPGFCAKTVVAPSDCDNDDHGSWSLGSDATSSFAARCIEKCSACRRCRFVSFSADFEDCSWFHSCDLGRLAQLGDGDHRRGCRFGSDFFSLRVSREARDVARTDWVRFSARCERAHRPFTLASVQASALAWDGGSEAYAAELKALEVEAARACSTQPREPKAVLRYADTRVLGSGGFCLLGMRKHRVASHFGAAPYSIPEVHFGAEPAIVSFLATRLRAPGSSLNDFGAGVGIYGLELLRLLPNVSYRGYDGAGDSRQATGGFVAFADLTFTNLSLPRADWLLSLEVGEHVPLQKEGAYVRNLHAHNCRGLVLSWGIVGQPGHHHVNTHRGGYVVSTFEGLGYVFNRADTMRLRGSALLAWFRKSIYVFERPARVC